MQLYSFYFFIFLAAVIILFYKIPRKFQWILLLISSYYFYASWKPALLLIILITTLTVYVAAILIQSKPRKKRLFITLALLINLGFLFVFKYLNFFSATLDQFTGISFPQPHFLLPIGISFYTLQVTGYLIDVYRKKIKPEKHLGHFALFVCFFPQLLAGPIERSTTLLPQIKKLPKFKYEQISDGLKLFTLGLFKKLVIADNLSVVVNRGFESLPEYKGISLILIIFLYTWQIYMDFSGYTDMARGVAKMVGINLLENFNLPYLSTSIQDFWKRWHISFSSWLRDYVYFMLGGSRKGMILTISNTFIVFTLSGLWHGAGWTFIIWGMLHAGAISLERTLKIITKDKIRLPTFLSVIYAYTLVSIFWIFFRSPTLHDAFYILRNSVVGIKNFASIEYISASINQVFLFNTVEIIITLSLVCTAIALEISQRNTDILTRINRLPALIRLLIFAVLIFLILQLRNAQIQEFIYTQF